MNVAFCISLPLLSHTAAPFRPPRRPRTLRQSPVVSTASAAYSSPPPPETTWQTHATYDLLLPPNPSMMVTFTGGFLAGQSPKNTYSAFLSGISQIGNAAIIAPHQPPPSTNHLQLSRTISRNARPAITSLRAAHGELPLFAMGHSLGAKLNLVACCDESARRDLQNVCGNVFISFNNANMTDAMPWGREDAKRAADAALRFGDRLRGANVGGSAFGSVLDLAAGVAEEVSSSFTKEFHPDAKQTFEWAEKEYDICRNLVLGFEQDTLDDSAGLEGLLRNRFGDKGVLRRVLKGSHVTPMSPELGDVGFYGIGNEMVDGQVRRTGQRISEELDGAIAVVVAFLRLQTQMMAHN